MLEKPSAKIAIGTVQFGLDYGISNFTGKVDNLEVKKILEKGVDLNFDTLDTAAVYGDSEEILGSIGVEDFKIVSKLPLVPKDCGLSLWPSVCLNLSLKKLKLTKIYGLLVHNYSDLLGYSGFQFYKSLCKLKDEGLVDKIGVSIYSPSELDLLYDNNINLDIVQSPFNIFDQRLKTSGWLDNLKSHGVEVHARSVFLQGLLLQGLEEIHPYFYKWYDQLDNFDKWLKDIGISRIDTCINFALAHEQIDKIIVGVLSEKQLIDIYNSTQKNYKINVPEDFKFDDEMLINPSKWSIS